MNVYRSTSKWAPLSILCCLSMRMGLIFAHHLEEPRALQDEQASSEQLQNNVVSYEHLQHGAGRSTEHRHQQQGVDVSVQRGPIVHVVIEQKPWHGRVEHKTWLKYMTEGVECDDVSHYNEKLSWNDDLVCQNDNSILRNNDLIPQKNVLISQNHGLYLRIMMYLKIITYTSE